MTSSPWDVAIIGGGIVGAATGMALARRGGVRVVVLEAEPALAAHQTGHNSGVIHSGLYYKPGSLKARNSVEGRRALYRFLEQHAIPHERCGKLVVATDPSEIPALDELERRGRANGLEGLRRLRGEELQDYEPSVVGVAGLLVPDTGIVDYGAVTRVYAGIVSACGGEVRTGARVLRVLRRPGGLVLETTGGPVQARALVNCAGLQSDRVARLCGVDPGVTIVPFRGESYEIVPGRRSLVRNLIYPVPDPRFPFLGVHFTRMIGGGVEAGPNAVLAFRREGYTRTSFSFRDAMAMFAYPGFWKVAAKYLADGDRGMAPLLQLARLREGSPQADSRASPGGRAQGRCGRPRPGARPPRPARGRLPRRPGRADRARPERPVSGGDRVARHRGGGCGNGNQVVSPGLISV